MINLTELNYSELEAFVLNELRQPKFRTQQIWQWVWQKGARNVSSMTNLSKPLREELSSMAEIRWPEIAEVAESRDGTIKFLLRLVDGELVETVLIPGKTRYTQCLSTQVGCAMGCTFCSTGLMGFTRNLSMGEILGQILVGRDYLEQREAMPLRNLVFMGMGEPLNNLENVTRSLRTMQSELGLAFSWRRATVSTVGLPRQLEKLGKSGLALPAISLHAPTQELREQIMPKAAKVHLDDLMAALDAYPMKQRERITFEYLVLRGVNDSIEHARQLVRLLGHRRCKVNLISFNPPKAEAGKLPYEPPHPEDVLDFEHYLHSKGMTATLRRSMGQDIGAACGQLKAAHVPDLAKDDPAVDDPAPDDRQ